MNLGLPASRGMWEGAHFGKLFTGDAIMFAYGNWPSLGWGGGHSDEDAAENEAGSTSGFLKNFLATLTGATPTWVPTAGSPYTSVLTGVAADGAGINAQGSWPHTIEDTGGGDVILPFRFSANGLPAWCEFRGKFDSLRTRMQLGFCAEDTTLIAATVDGLYIRYKDNDATPFLVQEKNSAEQEDPVTSDADYVANTIQTVGFRIDGLRRYIEVWQDGKFRNRFDRDNTDLPDDVNLAPSFAFLEGNDNAAVVTIEHMVWYQELR